MIKSFKYFTVLCFKKVIEILQNNNTGKIFSGMVSKKLLGINQMNMLTNNYLMLLNKLDPHQKPLWSKMTPQHMVEHLILAVRMSNDKLKLECFNPPEKIPTLKRFLMSSRPMPKLFVNPVIGADLRPLEYLSFEEAMERLKNEIDDYVLFFEKNPGAKTVNVTFGELNEEEWNVFHKKHFTHHISQFGLL